MRTSFNVQPDGTLNYINDRSAKNTDVYTLKGQGVEVLASTLSGQRNAMGPVSRASRATPTKDNFAGLVTHTVP